ncbi:inovirus Gp2 family protein [Chromobacterium alkanivorans]|uniref:inovirus Gp2 family protein n=1 Tax=Chromobacteriaceae TaxID=1499392 RepID=UPI000786ED5B|nr:MULTISPECIES: inovirus Gp2 family protein [Chromobacteriaceae]MBN3003735.1 inovirus Gp2 family protein [Chromobacterium alkanivorans]
MIRNAANTNQTLFYQPHFNNLPVMTDKGPLITEYLAGLQQAMHAALADYNRVFAFRVDIRFPDDLMSYEIYNSNEVIQRFLASFIAKINHARKVSAANYGRSHPCVVRYAWAREVGHDGKPHYHLVFLLNNDAYCTVGKYEQGRENIFNRLEGALASALRVSVEQVAGLVEIPRQSSYCLLRNDPCTWGDFFYRASYLTKVATKYFGNGLHAFGYSQR